jgi:hypothetical protein
MLSAVCIQGIEIRLTEERWDHIALEHAELDGQHRLVMDVLSKPDVVVAGTAGEFSAVRTLGSGRCLAVVYRITNGDGFVITAFYVKPGYYQERTQGWP